MTRKSSGYAKDGVAAVDFPTSTRRYGVPPAPASTPVVNGGTIGPVADGWLPGDPTSGPYNGTAFTNLSNVDNGGGANSTAYRIWCASGSTRITDWGQLTNLGPKLEVVDVDHHVGNYDGDHRRRGALKARPSPPCERDAVSGSGITAGTTVSSGGGTSTLDPVEGAGDQRTTGHADVTTVIDADRGSGLRHRAPHPGHGREHGLRNRGDLAELRRGGYVR